MALTADASPTKKFFIANLTRDLSLEDAILDLIDNAIDGYVRTHKVNVSPALLRSPEAPLSGKSNPVCIEITLTPDRFEIKDHCGGIGLERARKYAFRFGNVDPTWGDEKWAF